MTEAAIHELTELGSIAAVCTACRLAETRTNVVFGVGSPTADLMIIGEAPGHNEDLQGEPFVGRRAASRPAARRDRAAARRGVHRQRPEVPAAREP